MSFDDKDRLKLQVTQRGFTYADFRDRRGNYCSIQESSLVEPSLWLGVDKLPNGEKPGELDELTQLRLGARMHLSQQMVSELLPLLAFFATYGELPGNGE